MQETELAEPVDIPDIARFAPGQPPAADADSVAKAADLLLGAERPVLMMGRMSRSREDWDRRVRLAELLGAGVITDLKTAVPFPTGHPLHVGAPSLWLRDDRAEAVTKADAILALDWIDLAGSFKSAGVGANVAAQVVNCSVDLYAHNGWSMDHFGLPPSDLTIHADPDRFVAQLVEALEARLGGKPRWSGDAAAPDVAPDVAPDKGADDPLAPSDIGYALRAVQGGRQYTFTRLNLGWDGAVFPFNDPLDYIGADGGGGLGSATGITIGAALALQGSGRLPVGVIGDGDFMQGATALWTAARYQVPALFVVANNRSNFNDEVHQETVAKMRNRPVENKWIGQRIDDPAVDLAALARAQGVDATGPVKTWPALLEALEAGLTAVESGKPHLIDVWIEPGYSTPMVTR